MPSTSFGNTLVRSTRSASNVTRLNSTVEPEAVQASPLLDILRRRHDYLRISLTEKCSLRCKYCMPAEGVKLSPSDHLMRPDEIIRFASVVTRNCGIRKIRLTGGEPLLNRNLIQIVKKLNHLRPNVTVIGITTNGVGLASKLSDLKIAGLDAINISLDTLRPEKFQFITRRNGFKQVLKSIRKASEMNFTSLKLNCVVMRGLNDDEVLDFVALTESLPIDIRFIEYMPFDGNRWSRGKLVPYKQILSRIYDKYPSLLKLTNDVSDTSKSYQVPGFTGRIGFISSMTDHFCSGCSRIRLTADGNLKVCLFDDREYNIRDLIRANASDDEIVEFVRSSLSKKYFSHGGHAVSDVVNQKNRPMILIGG